jgi:hypothetical protein
MTATSQNFSSSSEIESLVQKILSTVEKQELANLRRDFHTRLRITLTQPESSALVEDLWDFFYDWCVFEQKILEKVESLSSEEKETWGLVKEANQRGLYSVQKMAGDKLKLKDLFSGKSLVVKNNSGAEFIGLSKGDIIEGRVVIEPESKNATEYCFARRPSFHPTEVHDYIMKKVKQFKKTKDVSTYQAWLWVLVGMYLKHRIYSQMPIEKIYDDNSRI